MGQKETSPPEETIKTKSPTVPDISSAGPYSRKLQRLLHESFQFDRCGLHLGILRLLDRNPKQVEVFLHERLAGIAPQGVAPPPAATQAQLRVTGVVD